MIANWPVKRRCWVNYTNVLHILTCTFFLFLLLENQNRQIWHKCGDDVKFNLCVKVSRKFGMDFLRSHNRPVQSLSIPTAFRDSAWKGLWGPYMESVFHFLICGFASAWKMGASGVL